MADNDVPGSPPSRSTLLRIVAGFLFAGAALSLLLALSDQARSLGPVYQVALAVSALISAVAAFGIWKHRKWGAWLYIGLTVLNQPFLLVMGWWTAGSLIIPGIVVALILFKYKWLR